MPWSEVRFIRTVLERGCSEHTTFEMCRLNFITFLASPLSYIAFCLSRDRDHTLLKYITVKTKL